MSNITHLNELCHTCEWFMTHTWMSHITNMNESCHKRHVTESWHTRSLFSFFLSLSHPSSVVPLPRAHAHTHTHSLSLSLFLSLFLSLSLFFSLSLCSLSLSLSLSHTQTHSLSVPSSLCLSLSVPGSLSFSLYIPDTLNDLMFQVSFCESFIWAIQSYVWRDSFIRGTWLQWLSEDTPGTLNDLKLPAPGRLFWRLEATLIARICVEPRLRALSMDAFTLTCLAIYVTTYHRILCTNSGKKAF